MEITIIGTGKEVAALVLALQERPVRCFIPETAEGISLNGANTEGHA